MLPNVAIVDSGLTPNHSEWLNETQQRKRKIWLSILIGFLLVSRPPTIRVETLS